MRRQAKPPSIDPPGELRWWIAAVELEPNRLNVRGLANVTAARAERLAEAWDHYRARAAQLTIYDRPERPE